MVPRVSAVPRPSEAQPGSGAIETNLPVGPDGCAVASQYLVGIPAWPERRSGLPRERQAETGAPSTIGFTTFISESIVSASYGAGSSAMNVWNPTFR
jgi:hypothetical protein